MGEARNGGEKDGKNGKDLCKKEIPIRSCVGSPVAALKSKTTKYEEHRQRRTTNTLQLKLLTS